MEERRSKIPEKLQMYDRTYRWLTDHVLKGTSLVFVWFIKFLDMLAERMYYYLF